MNGTTRRTWLGLLAAAARAHPQQLERRPAGRRILIAGAGIAGLTAAYELVKAGHDVTVFEAKPRAGGRIETLRDPFAEGLHGEAGAVRIGDHHADTLAYVREFGLELEPALAPGAAVFVTMGRRITSVAQESAFELREDERGLDPERLRAKYLGPLLKTARRSAGRAWPPEELRRFDGYSLPALLLQLGASPAAVEWMQLGRESENQSALLTLVEELAQEGAKQFHRIKGGNDLLPRAFARRLRSRIRYGAALVAVTQEENGLEAGILENGRVEQVRGEALICALPPPLLDAVRITPAVSQGKAETLRRTGMTPATRVFLQMRERFWQKAQLSGAAFMTGAAQRFWPGASGGERERGLLHNDARGRQARRLDAMDEAVRVEAVLREAEVAFPGARRYFEGSAGKSWEADPWQRGAFSEWMPGAMADAFVQLSRPEGRVYFAGEHCGTWGASIQGAIESALRAVAAVQARPWQPAP